EAGDAPRTRRVPLPHGASGPAWVGQVEDDVLISSAGKVFRFAGDGPIQVDLDGLGELLDSDEVPVIVEGTSGARWAFDNDSLFHFTPGSGWIELASAPYDVGGLSALLPDEHGGAWLGGSEALAHFRLP